MNQAINKGNGNAKGRLFKSPVLDAYTRTSPALTLSTYIPILASLMVLGNHYVGLSVSHALIWYFSGLFSWTLVEYFLHRYVFHFVDDREWTKKFHFMIHGIHHDYPRDDERLFMPPIPGVFYIAVILSFFGVVFGNYAFYFMPGLINGYLIYAFTHWAIHKFQPPKPFAPLWRHHMMHHYRYPEKAFGVSSMLWDRVFGTMPPDPIEEKK